MPRRAESGATVTTACGSSQEALAAGGFTVPAFGDAGELEASLFDAAAHFALPDELVEQLEEATDALRALPGRAAGGAADAAQLVQRLKGDYAQLRMWAARGRVDKVTVSLGRLLRTLAG